MILKKDVGLAVLRVGSAALMLTHGFPKLLKLFGEGEIQFGDPIGIGPSATLAIAVIGEFLCPLLILIGFKTRLATIPPILVMLVAAFLVHAQDPFGKKEKALLYLVMFVAILIMGPGKFSADHK